MPRRRRARSPLHRLQTRFRAAIRHLDRNTPEWMRWLTPWGSSLVLHALFILLLAIYLLSTRDPLADSTLQAKFADQLTEDLTSLEDGEVTGDPFTQLEQEQPPSLVLDMSQLDPEQINTPEVPPIIRLDDVVDLSRLAPTPAMATVGAGPPKVELGVASDLAAPFSGRQAEARAALVRRHGGTVLSERAVEQGLDWLSRHQHPDGHWSLDTSAQCNEARRCPRTPSMTSDSAATGLALLPFLGAGVVPDQPGRYQKTVEMGLDWLIQHQDKNGSLFVNAEGTARMYSHAIAAMTLSEAYGLTRTEVYREPSQKAIDFIVAAQNKADGGWRYGPGDAGDTSVLGWQLFALRSAKLAGLEMPDATIQGTWNYLNLAAADPIGATYAYQPGNKATPVMTAEALLVRQYLGWPANHPALLRGTSQVAADLLSSKSRNIYYWYYATQLLHNMQGPAWVAWNVRVRDALVQMQVQGKGCDRGSWNPMEPVEDQWGRRAGRLFVTSLSLLTLEVYYRYLPLYRARDDNPFRAAEAARDPAKKADAKKDDEARADASTPKSK